MKYLILKFLIITTVYGFGQRHGSLQDSSSYQIIDNYPLYNYCKNCKKKENRSSLLCGHCYRSIFLGYSYDERNWVEIGFSKDNTSCFPEKGSNYFAFSYSILVNNEMINSLKLSYAKDNLFGLQFYFVKYGVNIETVTNYEKTDIVIRPEIRISDNMDYNRVFRRVNIIYGYNFNLNKYFNNLKLNHQITLIYNLFEKGHLS